MWDLVRNPEDWFSHNAAHIYYIAKACLHNETFYHPCIFFKSGDISSHCLPWLFSDISLFWKRLIVEEEIMLYHNDPEFLDRQCTPLLFAISFASFRGMSLLV